MAPTVLKRPKSVAFSALEAFMNSPVDDGVGLTCPVLGKGGEEWLIRESEEVFVQG